MTQTDADGNVTTTLYDGDGQVTGTIDPDGHLSQTLYDADGRPIATVDADGHRTTSLYDGDGNVTGVLDPDNNLTQYAYDAAGNKIQTTDPSGHVSTAAYDKDEELISSTDALGRTRAYRYDADGHIVGETWTAADGVTIDNLLTFAYDPDGNQTLAADFAGTTTFAYDADGRMTGEQEPFGVVLTFGYDQDGNQTLEQDNFGGITTSLYDDNGQLTTREFGGPGQTPLRMDYTYLPTGEVGTLKQYADLAGTDLVGQTSYGYDNADQVTDIQHSDGSGTVLASYLYGYDADGRVIAQTIDGVPTTYGYDAAGQLTSAGASLYGFDANGNRDTGSNVIGANNLLESDGTWTYSYDSNNNLIKKSQGVSALTWTYGYDEQNRMIWRSNAPPMAARCCWRRRLLTTPWATASSNRPGLRPPAG